MLGNGFMAFQHRNSMIIEFFIRKFLNLEKMVQRTLSQMRFIEPKARSKAKINQYLWTLFEFIDSHKTISLINKTNYYKHSI